MLEKLYVLTIGMVLNFFIASGDKEKDEVITNVKITLFILAVFVAVNLLIKFPNVNL